MAKQTNERTKEHQSDASKRHRHIDLHMLNLPHDRNISSCHSVLDLLRIIDTAIGNDVGRFLFRHIYGNLSDNASRVSRRATYLGSPGFSQHAPRHGLSVAECV
jgi:hypothetical protein